MAKFDNLVDSFAGLVALLSSQFSSVKFTPPYVYGFVEDSPDGFENAVGDYFQVKYPLNWPDDEKYDFDWAALDGDPDPIQNFDY